MLVLVEKGNYAQRIVFVMVILFQCANVDAQVIKIVFAVGCEATEEHGYIVAIMATMTERWQLCQIKYMGLVPKARARCPMVAYG